MIEDHSYGYNSNSEEILDIVKANNGPTPFREVVEQVGFTRQTAIAHLNYLLGKGEVIRNPRGRGKTLRLQTTPNREFEVESHTNKEIISQVRQQLNDLKEQTSMDENTKLRIMIQKVE